MTSAELSTGPLSGDDRRGPTGLDGPQIPEGGWCLSWLWWVAVGAAFGIGVVGLLTIGWVFLGLGMVLGVLGAVVPWVRNQAALGTLAGLAVAPLTLAWFNREGPGTVCHVDGSVTTCVDQWSPWPFLIVAVVLIAGALLLEGRRRRTP